MAVLGSACSLGLSLPNQIAHHAERSAAWRMPHRADLQVLVASAAIRTRNSKGLTVSSAEEWKPGQDTQAVATARLQEQDPDKIHCPAWGAIGNLGDSICYAGVPATVEE